MEVIKKVGQLQLRERGAGITLTDERQLDRIIQGPETPLFGDLEENHESKSLYKDKNESLLSRVKAGAERNATNMSIAYDFFFGGNTRSNYPSDEITIKAFKVVHDTAKEYGMTFEASILSPLDVGGGWIKQSDETGFSMQYLETEIKPDGSYAADLVGQLQWVNNKGPIRLTPHQVLVYAFNEERVGDTPYFYVDENAIEDISATATYVMDMDNAVLPTGGYGHCPLHISGKWENPTANRALCIMVYRTPELDYFADSAHSFMKKLLDDHNAAGISYHAFYSDEMHIQFDWDLENHFGETEINVRYVTPALAKVYAEKYGEKYRDFAKYLIYMSYHQHDFLPGEAGKENAQHVFGKTPQDICNTWLFRNRYFELLQRTVVDLSKEAKAYAEELWGSPILTAAHATWQESPTCDHFSTVDLRAALGEEYAGIDKKSSLEDRARLQEALAAKEDELGVSHYDYTPLYAWSSSIRENISACYDYFKWNEFLTGSGTDHAECGFTSDRNYYAQCLGASFADLNDFERAYAACWGMPGKIMDMYGRVNTVYGVGQAGPVPHGHETTFVNGLGTRRTDVLALYPIKLNNVEERFGSWMVQYGYCNYATEEKLLENAVVTENGTLSMKGQEYRCLVVMFEPFLDDKTFDLIEKFLAAGGKVVWMSIPALTNAAGEDVSERFKKIFGLASIAAASEGEKHQGEKIAFTGRLSGIRPMTVPTDFVVDMVYPCLAADGAEVSATLNDHCVGVCKRYENGGLALYAGFRVRDDQSASLGEDIDSLYRVLVAMGAYRPGSLEVRSRATESAYVYNTFADGSIAVAPHFRKIREAWEGPFFREKDYDEVALSRRPDITDPVVELNEEIAGHAIRFAGEELLAYRLDEGGAPVSFFGIGTDGMEVDGKKYTFADRKAKFEIAPIPARYLADDVKSATVVTCWTENTVLTVPAAGKGTPKVLVCDWDLFGANTPVEHTWDGRSVTFTVTPEMTAKRIMVVF